MNLDKWIIKISGIFTLIAITTFLFFQYSTQKIDTDLDMLSRQKVAGIETTREASLDLQKIIPMPIDTKITGIDKLRDNKKEKLIITLISNGTIDINNFYKDNLNANGWEEIEQNSYAKENKQLQIKVENEFTTITLITE